ncbi:hypothetical protein ACFL6P_06780 [Candidatus Latescibacterota bacterium]
MNQHNPSIVSAINSLQPNVVNAVNAVYVTPDVPMSPVINNNPEEDITLIPYGCAPIRITYFPVADAVPSILSD